MFISSAYEAEEAKKKQNAPNTTTINPPTRLTNTTNINFDKILNAIFYLGSPPLDVYTECTHRRGTRADAQPQSFGNIFEYNLFSPRLLQSLLASRHPQQTSFTMNSAVEKKT